MQTITKVALDAMGGDNAPAEIVKGAVDAVSSREDIKVFLVGQEDVVREELQKYPYPQERIEVVDAPEVIEMAEPPVQAIRKKKQSSLVVGMNMVKQREADAFVSAGSSGAVLVGGQTIVGRIRGIKRPPLAPIIPTETGISLLIDCGANVDARPEHLLQFAKMGSIYMENVVGIKNPRVAIVNIGAEEEKGNALVKETFPLLKECEDINFVGSIEAREIPHGGADVIVCEPILSIITNYAEQFRFTVIVHNVPCGQALTLVHPHIQRCILTPVGKTAFRCIQLERRNSQIENDSIHFFDSEILQHVRHLCIIASYDGNPVCIIFQSLCGSGNGIRILVDSDESSGCQMSAYFQ